MALGRSSSPKSCNGSVKSFRSSGKSHSSGNSQLSTSNRLRYKGLFTSDDAPTGRAYCILFSFFTGVLLITVGSVFIRVKLMHPMSGIHPMHTPPWPLALGLIAVGLFTVLTSCATVYRYGLDDGDDSLLEEDHLSFAKDDIRHPQYFSPSKNYYDNRAYSTPNKQTCTNHISHSNAQSYDDIRSQCQEQPNSINQSYESLCNEHPQKPQPLHYFSNISIYPSKDDYNSPRVKNFINSQMQDPGLLRTTGSCIQLNEQNYLPRNNSYLQFQDQRSISPNSSCLQFNDDYSPPRVKNFVNNQMQEPRLLRTTDSGSCIQLNEQDSLSPNSSCLQFHDHHSISPNSSCLQFNDQTSISPNSSCHQIYVQGPISPKGVRFQDQVSVSPNSSCLQLYDQNSSSPNSSILKYPVQDFLSPNNSSHKINMQSSPVTYSNIFLHNKGKGNTGKAITQIYIGTPD
ncbi:unnamed protein product, partial [Meganyctiphanes norvegica]